jgi:predicted exporter
LAAAGFLVASPGGHPGFDARLSSLRPPTKAFELGAEITRAFRSRNPNSLALLAYGDTELSAVGRAAEQERQCRALQAEMIDGLPGLESYQSIMRFLPPPELQQKTLARLRGIDWDQSIAAFRSALGEELNEEHFGLPIALLERHRDRVRADELLLPSALRGTPLWRHVKRLVASRRRALDLRQPLPGDLAFPVTLALPARGRADQVVVPAGATLDREALLGLWRDAPEYNAQVKRVTLERDGWVVKTILYAPTAPGSPVGDPAMPPAWLPEAKRRFGLPDPASEATMTGQALMAMALAAIVKTDFWRISLAVLAMATLTMLAFFRREPVRVVWSLVPIALGVLYVIGFMALCGLDFNYVNTLAVPILIGLGVDNGIHVTERFFEAGRRLGPTIADTGRAVVITALTSMAGFGSLALAGYAGIASLGWLTIYGLTAVGLSSLVALPAMLAIVHKPVEEKNP